MWRDLSKTLRELLQVTGHSGGSYRPDLHYMRGPGPKWHAKYGGSAAQSPENAGSAPSVLSETAEHRA